MNKVAQCAPHCGRSCRRVRRRFAERVRSIFVGPADDLVQLARVINPSLQRWQSRRRRATTVPICLDLRTARRVSAGSMAPPFCAAPRSVQLDLPERRRGNGRKMLAY